MKRKLTVVKIGGNVIDDPGALAGFLKAFAALAGPKLLVHGGGALASTVMKGMGIEPRMVNGRRITDAPTLKVVTMVYAGWINKDIVAKLQALGCNAAGFSGADLNVIPAVRRAAEPVDFGFVGDVDPEAINATFIEGSLSRDVVPVFCAITHDGRGNLLNTNADTIASAVAVAMSNHYSVELIYCFDKGGVLADPDDDGSVIPELGPREFECLRKSGAVTAGMLAKLENVFFASRRGVDRVVVRKACDLASEVAGTVIRPQDT